MQRITTLLAVCGAPAVLAAQAAGAIELWRLAGTTLPVAQAFEEIAGKSGTHFAPECARAFLGLRERIAAQLQ